VIGQSVQRRARTPTVPLLRRDVFRPFSFEPRMTLRYDLAGGPTRGHEVGEEEEGVP